MEREGFDQQFGEKSGEAQTSKIVPKEQSWYDQDIPHEHLVETLRYFSERARIHEYQQAREEWEPATWLEWELRCQAVAAYNAKVAQASSLIDQYNDILEKYNALVGEEQQLFKAIDSRPRTVESQ